MSPRAFKAPSKGIFGNDYAAELEKQGLSEAQILERVVGRDIELTSESGEISYIVLALDRRTGKMLWQREAHRGPPHRRASSEEHLRVRDAGHRR